MASPPCTGFADMRFKPTRDSSGIERVASGMLSLQSLHEDTKNIRDYQIGTISRRRLTLSAIVCV